MAHDKVIKKLQMLNEGHIVPYKHDYLKAIPAPPQSPKRHDIKDHPLTPKDLLKIYDLNAKMSTVMEYISTKVNPGADVADLDTSLYTALAKTHKLYPSTFNYHNFPQASCISVNDTVCHAVPYSYQLDTHDIVTIDVTAFSNGFHTDVAHTFIPSPQHASGNHRSLVNTTKLALNNAIAICRPNQPYHHIGKVVEKTAKENGFTVLKQFKGHGIGPYLHMEPLIHNYHHIPPTVRTMQEGDMFSIEPLLSCGHSYHTNLMNDGFTYTTQDGSYAAHFERVVLITHSGHKVLNDF
jgi:methionyl aminopeptidase